ncbi:MAG: hypothetical protein KBA66_16990 [Leptospiraceae bacterium]|nr:hypothetical protein [Leptospiraceae bacterium]
MKKIFLIILFFVNCNQPISNTKFNYTTYDIIAPPNIKLENLENLSLFYPTGSHFKLKIRNRLMAIENAKSYHVSIVLSKLEIEFERERNSGLKFFEILKPISFNSDYTMQINENKCFADINHYSYNLASSSLKIRKNFSLESLGLFLVLFMISINNNLASEFMLSVLGIEIYDTYNSAKSLKTMIGFLEDRFILEIEQQYINCIRQHKLEIPL